jgi:hypothetical protein
MNGREKAQKAQESGERLGARGEGFQRREGLRD